MSHFGLMGRSGNTLLCISCNRYFSHIPPFQVQAPKVSTEWLDDNTGTKSASKTTLLTLKEQIIQDANEALENLQCYILEIIKMIVIFRKVKFIAEQKTVNQTTAFAKVCNFRR